MVGKIDAFIDCVSIYSYFAFVYLSQNRQRLASHGVDIEFHPVWLAGILGGSGNKPPWVVPAKGRYLTLDTKRAMKYFGLPNVSIPDFFPMSTLLPQRCMTFVKDKFPRERYEQTCRELWIAIFEQGVNISEPKKLAQVLAHHFEPDDVLNIMDSAQTPETKQKLADTTRKALDHGAFGAPFFWVRNAKGGEEPFFGSDRFHFMWEYLGIPWSDISIPLQAKI